MNKSNSEEVLGLLSDLHQEGQGIVMVTHDVRAALHGTRILYMEDGRDSGQSEGRRHDFRLLQFNAVVVTNIHAGHLYERLGFVQLGTILK